MEFCRLPGRIPICDGLNGLSGPRRLARGRLWVLIVVGLLMGGLVAFWATSRSPGRIYPGDYVGIVPPGVELGTYPRLVPWELRAITEEKEITVLQLDALAGACLISNETGEYVTETFDRIEVRETAETVTIETWLGPPERDGFWPGCLGVGWSFPVSVTLETPLGSRELLDPACELDRHSNFEVCEHAKLTWLR